MEHLEKSHPAAYRELKQGQFAVQRVQGRAFAQVPVDQAIEQSLNRDTKTRGGIIGFSLKPGAVHRWIITTRERSAVPRFCKELTGLEVSSENHKVGGQSACLRSAKEF